MEYLTVPYIDHDMVNNPVPGVEHKVPRLCLIEWDGLAHLRLLIRASREAYPEMPEDLLRKAGAVRSLRQ